MDLGAIQETIYFASGIAAAVLGAYGTMKAQNTTIYPIAKIEAGKAKIAALTEGNAAIEEVQAIAGNISLEELSGIIAKAQELSVDGFTAAEAQELGILFLEAVKCK